MHKSGVFAVAACAALLVSGAALAQQNDTVKTKAKSMTYTGCVEQGKTAGTYMLTHVMAGEAGSAAQTSGKKARAPKMLHLESTSSAQIAPEAGHKVTVMGSTMRGKGGPMMKVESIKSVSPNCP